MRESHSKVYDKILEAFLQDAICIQRMNRNCRVSEGTDQAQVKRTMSFQILEEDFGSAKTPPSAVEAMRKLPKLEERIQLILVPKFL